MGMSDFDDVLKILRLGKWNLMYYFGLGLCSFMVPCFIYAGGFVAPNLEFECDTTHIGEIIQKQNCTSENKCSYLLQEIIVGKDQCTYTVLSNNISTDQESAGERQCSKWTYNSTNFDKTLTNELNLVCDMSYLRPVYQTVYNVGNFIGAPLNGFLADRYGRKMLLIFSSVVGVGSILVATVASNFTILLISRFVTGLTSYPLLQTGYILGMEVCEPKHRTVVGILLGLPWAFGTMWWGVLGFLIKDWRWLMRATTIPAFFYFALLPFMDESPRWLIVQGCHRKALKALKKAAKWNHSVLPSDEELLKRMISIQKSSRSSEESKKEVKVSPSFSTRIKGGMKHIIILYKTPELRKRSLLMYIVFIVSATVFYGLTLNAANFQLDPFMYMVVGGLTEIPAYSLTAPIVAKLGRIPPTAAFYFICSLTILTLAFIPSDPKWLIITLAMIGKFCISAAYQIIYLMATELFPTEVRMQGLGTSSFVGTIGSISSPFITDLLGNRYPWVPSLIFGGLSLLAGIASIFIPETLNKNLPDTVQQLEREAKYGKTGSNEGEIQTLQMTGRINSA